MAEIAACVELLKCGTTAECALKTLFVVAFLFPPLLVVTYYAWTVRARRRELMAMLFSDELEPEKWKDRPEDHPAWGLAQASAPKNSTSKKPTNGDALRRAVDARFESIQGTGQYALPLMATLVISAAGLYLCHAWVHARWFLAVTEESKKVFPSTIQHSTIMALAGAYVWGVWEILARRQSGDLTPSELWDVAFRWLIAIPIGHAFSLLAISEANPMMAFVASAFPLKDIRRFMQKWALKRLDMVNAGKGRPEELNLGTAIDGLSDDTLTRLGELGIVTALDMAFADPMRIMIKTGYPMRNVLDWMDQAVLAVYVGERRKAFMSAGIRCSIDLCEFVNMHVVKDGKRVTANERTPEDNAAIAELKRVLDPAAADAAAMLDLLVRVHEDPQVKMLFQLWYSHGAPASLGGAPRGLLPA